MKSIKQFLILSIVVKFTYICTIFFSGFSEIFFETLAAQVVKNNYRKQELYITMRDGVRLFTSVYTPEDTSKKYPIILWRTPYNAEPDPDKFNPIVNYHSRYLNGEYIMVFQDVRGKYMSEGTYVDIRPVVSAKNDNTDIDETTDTWDTIDWLIKNIKNNNGNVGLMGKSYPGFYATMGLIDSHPALKAVSPQAPVTNWFKGDDWHHNGALFLVDCFQFFYWHGQVHQTPTREWFPGFDWPVPDNYEFFLSQGTINNLKSKYFGDTIQFINDIFAHPNYNEFWQLRDPLPHLNNVKPAVLTVGGWFDAEDLWGALHTYKAIEKQNPGNPANYLVMGPWRHDQWMRWEAINLGNIYWGMDANEKYLQLEMDFFDYYLRGKGNFQLAEATIFVTGLNEWRNFETWPPVEVQEKNMYFQQEGSLSFLAPAVENSFDEYISDPMKPVPYTEDVHKGRTREYMVDDQRFASRRPDVMVYQTNVLDEDITITGPIAAHLFVSTTGTDADYVVKLIDVFPPDKQAEAGQTVNVPLGHYQMLVRGEVMRGKFRNSFETPEPFVPDEITEVSFELPDVAHTFKQGHKIMIQMQNSWFPLVNRNPQKFIDIYHCSEDDFQKATHRIYHDSNHPSHLKIKTVNIETIGLKSPSPLQAFSTDDLKIELNWNDNSENEEGYYIYYKKESDSAYIIIDSTGPDVTSEILSNETLPIEFCTAYDFFVTAYHGDFESDSSNQVSTKTTCKPPAPSLLNASVNSSLNMDLLWSDPCNYEDGFYIYYRKPGDNNFKKIDSTIADVYHLTLENQIHHFDTCAPYDFYITTYFKFFESDSSNNISILTPCRPQAPLSLTATAIDELTVLLNWSDMSDNEEGFHIYYKEQNEAAYTYIKSTGADTESLLLFNASQYFDTCKIYEFYIMAYNNFGESDSSIHDTIRTTCSTVGILKEYSGPIEIYPNPLINKQLNVYIGNGNEESLFIEVYNMKGLKVLEKEIREKEDILDMSAYPAGVYYLRIRGKTYINWLEKIVLD
ncbi:CocE/NonD family hydrolase [Bacteroidota bacterium]